MTDAIHIDFRERGAYNRSIRALRKYLASAEGHTQGVIEIRVLQQGVAPVVLFLGKSTGAESDSELRFTKYVIGFRGKNGAPFALLGNKPDQSCFLRQFQDSLGKNETVSSAGFGATHRDLDTYSGPFPRGTTAAFSKLSEFDGRDIEQVRRPLGLLVCMIAEAVRFVSVQGQCADVVDGKRDFKADSDLLTTFGDAQTIADASGSKGLTLGELRSLRARVMDDTRVIYRALHLPTAKCGVGDLLGNLYGGRRDPDFLRLDQLAQSDVNVQRAIEDMRDAVLTLIDPARDKQSTRPLTAKQIDFVQALVNKLRDEKVLAAAANLTPATQQR
jgi:Ribosome inactivating protein